MAQQRLTVNLNEATAKFLSRYMEEHGQTATESTRRAFGVLKFIEDELRAGRVIQSANPDGTERRDIILM